MRLSELDKNMIYHLMLQSEPVPIGRLAELCDVSSNTIRSRILLLNEMISSSNLHISVRRSLGCVLEKIDESETSGNLKYTISRSRYIEDHYSRDFVIRYVISSPDYVPINEMCDSLGYSYSELHRTMKYVDEFLDDFHLKMVTKRNQGLAIEGSEYHKRLCMVFMHKPFHSLSEQDQKKESRFGAMFVRAGGEAFANRTLSEILIRHPAYRFSFLNFPKITNMAALISSRYRYASLLSFHSGDTDKILESEAYVIADEYMKKLGKLTGYEPSVTEVVSLAVTMQCYRSLTDLSQMNPQERDYYCREAESVLNNDIRHAFQGFNDSWKETHLKHLACLLYTIETMMHFRAPLDQETIFPLQDTGTMSVDFTVDLYHYMKNERNMEIPKNLLLYASYFTRGIVRDISTRNGYMNVLLMSLYGSEYAQNAKSILMRMYSRTILNIDVYDSPNTAFEIDPSDYDFLLTDISDSLLPANLRDNLPVIDLPFINSTDQIASVESYFRKSIQLYLNSISSGKIRHTSFRNEKEVYDEIYSILSDSFSITREETELEIRRRNRIVSPLRANHVAFLAFDYYSAEDDVLLILLNDKGITFEGEKVQFFVFYNLTRSHIRSFININAFLHRFVRRTPAELKALLDVPVDQIVNTLLEYPEMNLF